MASIMNLSASARIEQTLVSAKANAFRSARAAFPTRRMSAKIQRRTVAPQAYMKQYPDAEFMESVKAAFPDKMIASVEEARCLIAQGYTFLDVRSDLETDRIGKWKSAVTVPIVHATFKYDPEKKEKVVEKEDNPNWLAMVQKKLPNKDTPIIVACANGTQYSLDALEQLDEAGYTNLVGLKGGYYAWFRTFDNNLRRRMNGEYAEQYTHDGDTCGIHASGAGFERVDSIEAYTPPIF